MENQQTERLDVKPKLCYISVVALSLALIIFVIPSPPRDLLPLSLFALMTAVISLFRFKNSDVKLRGKGLAIAAFTISLTHMFFLIVILVIKYDAYKHLTLFFLKYFEVFCLVVFFIAAWLLYFLAYSFISHSLGPFQKDKSKKTLY